MYSLLLFVGVYYSEDQLVYVIINSIFFLTNCIIRILIWRKLISEFTYNILPYLIWIFVCGQLCLDIFSGSQVIAPNAMIGWHCFVIFTLYTSLPVHVTMIMLLCTASILGHCLVVTLSTLGQPEEHLFDYAKSVSISLVSLLFIFLLFCQIVIRVCQPVCQCCSRMATKSQANQPI